jgi:hypothetical protein
MTGIRVEHLGDNRSGKTLTNAIFAWEAYNRGKTVLCNCSRIDPVGEGVYDCILNFPHYHFDMGNPFAHDWHDCYLMTDETVEFLDSRVAAKKEVREFGHFGYQVLKRGIEWHYDTVLHENIEKRIRKSPEYQVRTERIPRDVQLPLMAIRVTIASRWGHSKSFFLTEPWRYYPLYNDRVRVLPLEAQ